MSSTFLLNTQYKNYVFIGEAGSGKSELSMNWAAHLAENSDSKIDYFDLDQTKPNFRSREYADILSKYGIAVHYNEQKMDTPVLASGVLECLADPDRTVVLDIGGNAIGARMIGQLSHVVQATNTVNYYVVNIYRPWSGSEEHILQTLLSLESASGLNNFRIISNPNYGSDTTPEDVIKGNSRLKEMINSHFPIEFLTAESSIAAQLTDAVMEPIFPMQPWISKPWLI